MPDCFARAFNWMSRSRASAGSALLLVSAVAVLALALASTAAAAGHVTIDYANTTFTSSPRIFGGAKAPNPSQQSDVFPKLAGAGVTIIRSDAYPEQIVPANTTVAAYTTDMNRPGGPTGVANPATWDWSRLAWIANAKAQGMQVMLLFFTSPRWLTYDGQENDVPSDWTVYEDIVAKIYAHLQANVDYVEVLNEPFYFLTPSAASGSYFDNYQLAAKDIYYHTVHAVRSVSSTVPVGGVSDIPGSPGFGALSAVLDDVQNGRHPALDFVTVHSYGADPAGQVNFASLRSLLASHGKGGLPIYVSEWNAVGDDQRTTEQAISFVGKTLIGYINNGVMGANYFAMWPRKYPLEEYHDFYPLNARYLRLYITQPQRDAALQAARIYELQVFGQNLALAGSPADPNAATDNCSPFNLPATNATDGIVETKWCAQGRSSYDLDVDLGSATTVTNFTVQNAGAGGEDATLNTRAFSIESSTDGTTWTDRKDISANTDNSVSADITSASARFWRLHVTTATQPGGDGTARIDEFALYGPDLAQGSTATADSTTCAGVAGPPASDAVDGSLATKWCADGAGPHWLKLDLGSAQTIGKFQIKNAGAGGESSGFDTKDFKIQWSTDGSTSGDWRDAVRASQDLSENLFGQSASANVITCGGGPFTTPAVDAIDGSVLSKWCADGASTTHPDTLTVDLTANYNISQFITRHAGAGGESSSYDTRDFTIATSTDGSNWTTRVTVTANTQDITKNDITPVNARFVRLSVTNAGAIDSTVRIPEFEVYGTPAATDSAAYELPSQTGLAYYTWNPSTSSATLLSQSYAWRLASKDLGLGDGNFAVKSTTSSDITAGTGAQSATAHPVALIANDQGSSQSVDVTFNNLDRTGTVTVDEYLASATNDASSVLSTVNKTVSSGSATITVTVPAHALMGLRISGGTLLSPHATTNVAGAKATTAGTTTRLPDPIQQRRQRRPRDDAGRHGGKHRERDAPRHRGGNVRHRRQRITNPQSRPSPTAARSYEFEVHAAGPPLRGPARRPGHSRVTRPK